MNPYIICFHSISGEQDSFSYHLDSSFWDLVESSEVREGELDAKIEVKKLCGRSFELLIFIKGEVELLCDRCLEPLQLPVDMEERLLVKFGPEFRDEGDELIIVSEREGTADMSRIFYELIMLSLPVTRVHDQSHCNPEMLKFLVGKP